MPKDPNAILSPTTAGDAAFSCDFPNYMSGFDAPSDITYKTMESTSKEFKLHELSGIYDPATPTSAPSLKPAETHALERSGRPRSFPVDDAQLLRPGASHPR
ncbi:hypothetical protein [Nocardioides panzhihuensis]|uniref:Uncharacterized protein n=1 Tax=Nocardioides panzhihuensis TaxID=860243 RepID=A0A7Z0DHS7_9ACTN|nr:hypothetical protein [Nocardioides panzhihuensis]NYI75567.1 hypothetical protein [Nocardioides panzhihuensis]